MLISASCSAIRSIFSCSKTVTLQLMKVLNFSDLSKVVRIKESARQRFVSLAIYITCIKPQTICCLGT